MKRDVSRGGRLWLGLWVSLGAAAVAARAADRERDAALGTQLEQLLDTGLRGRFDGARVNRHAAAARRLSPRDPVVEFAVGLVLLKRNKVPQAVGRLQAALRKSNAYLPAWKLLLRTRLVQNEGKRLRQDAGKLAAAVVSSRSRWETPAGRRDAAEFLGRVVAYCELPDVKLLSADDLKELDGDLRKTLGKPFVGSYERGKSKLLAEFKELKTEVARGLIKQSLKARRVKDEKLSAIDRRQAAARQKAQNLKRTAAQWRTWYSEQTNEVKKQLTELQKDYAALQVADARVARLNTQTTIDIGQLQTELSLRGFRGRVADMQPAMLRLQQESMRYTTQRLALQQRAAGVRRQVGTVLSAYVVATRQYQAATGSIVKQDASVKLWQKLLAKSSVNLQEKAPSKRPAARLQAQLTAAESYFPLDFESASHQLLQPFRPQPAQP